MRTHTVQSPVTFDVTNLVMKREYRFWHNNLTTPSDTQTKIGRFFSTDTNAINMEIKLINCDIMDCVRVTDNRTQTCILRIFYVFTSPLSFNDTKKIKIPKLYNLINSYLAFMYEYKIKCK